MRIDQLPDGCRARIIRIDDSARDGLRLRELGFDEGVEVEVRYRSIFGGDPLAVRVGSNFIAMRKAYARLIEVE